MIYQGSGEFAVVIFLVVVGELVFEMLIEFRAQQVNEFVQFGGGVNINGVFFAEFFSIEGEVENGHIADQDAVMVIIDFTSNRAHVVGHHVTVAILVLGQRAFFPSFLGFVEAFGGGAAVE